MKAILGIGRPTLDLLGTLSRLPARGGSAELRQFSIQGAGPAATATVALARWGYAARFLGSVGDDPYGRLIREGLEEPGVGTDLLRLQAERISPFAFVALDEDDGRLIRTRFRSGGNLEPLPEDALDAAALDGVSALLVDGSEPAAQAAAATKAREAGVQVFFRAKDYNDGTAGLIDRCDVLIASERFAAEAAPRGEPSASLAELCQRGPHTVIVTMGDEGAIGRRGDSVVEQPILPLAQIEPSGAGDIFFAGVTHGVLSEWPLHRTLRFASAAAGLVCREIGRRAGIPALDEVVAAVGAG